MPKIRLSPHVYETDIRITLATLSSSRSFTFDQSPQNGNTDTTLKDCTVRVKYPFVFRLKDFCQSANNLLF